MKPNEFILKEGVLNDNVLLVPHKGYIFKGGYIARIKEYVYQNCWSNREIIKNFRSKERLFEYLDKKYPEIASELYFEGTAID